jgi:hypothetical protein
MLRPTDAYFLQQEEPVKSCLQFLREHILRSDAKMTEAWKYKTPFYCYKGKIFCYLWIHKKYRQPYIGFIEGRQINHPDLVSEKRTRIKILLLDPNKDMPIETIDAILNQLLPLYKKTFK